MVCCNFDWYQLRNRAFWCNQGVSIDNEVKVTAYFMIGSLLPFAIVQGVAFTKDKEATKVGAIVALCACIATFVIYSAFTIRQEGVMATKAKFVQKKQMRLRYLAAVRKQYATDVQKYDEEKDEAVELQNGGGGGRTNGRTNGENGDEQSMAERFHVTSRELFGGRSRHRAGSASNKEGVSQKRHSSFNVRAMDAVFNEFKRNDPIERALKKARKVQKQTTAELNGTSEQSVHNKHHHHHHHHRHHHKKNGETKKMDTKEKAKIEQTMVARQLVQNIGKPSQQFLKKQSVTKNGESKELQRTVKNCKEACTPSEYTNAK